MTVIIEADKSPVRLSDEDARWLADQLGSANQEAGARIVAALDHPARRLRLDRAERDAVINILEFHAKDGRLADSLQELLNRLRVELAHEKP